MAQRRVKNLLALAVLSYLTQRPMHPYELQRTLIDNDAGQTFRLSYGSLYNVVQQLADAGFIAQHGVERAGRRPERTVYALTEAGRVEMHDWLQQLLAEPQRDHPSFVAALSLLAALRPDEAVDCLRQRVRTQDAERRRTAELVRHTLEQGIHPLFLVEDDYRLRMLAAELDFLDELITRIERPDGGWAATWVEFHDHKQSREDPA